jgi:hypothetical protein
MTLSSIARLSRGAGRGRGSLRPAPRHLSARRERFRVVWTRDSGAAPERELRPGERLVEDLVLEAETPGVERAHTTPGVTQDPDDHGVVHDEQLRRIGRVVSRKGGGRLIEWE